MILTDELNIQKRSANLIYATVRDVPGAQRWRLLAAPRLEAAYGPTLGLAGGTAQQLFVFDQGRGYISPTRAGVPQSDSARGQTRLLWDPEEFATPVNVYPNNYIPGDDRVVYLRAQRWDPTAGAWGTPGPIAVVPPAGFYSSPRAVFTMIAMAPNLGTGAYDMTPVDVMPPNSMVLTLPIRGQTFQITNLAPSVGGAPLYVSFSPGMPPYVILPQQNLSLVGVTPTAFYLGSPNGNPRFSLAVATSTSL